jgi:serine/threonine protein kinase
MDCDLALIIIYQVLSAVHHLHSLGLWHRDIKPSNVLQLAWDGSYIQVVLCDFGLTRAQPSRDSNQPTFNVGTPNYQAPELLDPDLAALVGADPSWNRTDVWATATMLVALLKGGRGQACSGCRE